MTNDWTIIRILTGLGMYLLVASTCSLVNYHRNQKPSTSNTAHLATRFDKGELCPWGQIGSIQARRNLDCQSVQLGGLVFITIPLGCSTLRLGLTSKKDLRPRHQGWAPCDGLLVSGR